MSSSERWSRIAAWFDELVELPESARRERLAAIAREDTAAAAEVAALLDADARTDGVLDASVTSIVPDLSNADSAAPADGRAGPYRLLHAIGEGGMGAVFLAERSDGSYEQRVAVKLIKRGMDSVAIVRRFLRERSILARLVHPNIVRLLDGGLSADGRPYYAMEYVDGRTITDYAAAKQLSIRERVALIADVAETVAYAHTQLVVHRDLKPSNVLIDAEGRPRVLDFGIAKLIEGNPRDDVTQTGMRVLSPAYAAPEQRSGEAIGTATDVYALGLVLCELLIGQLPPARASTANDDAEETSHVSALAAHLAPERVTELYGPGITRAQLVRALKGDIDVMIATALKREPSRRYPTAAAFADDLRRWLAGRPIGARADSSTYRLAKFVRRHRLGVAATALIAVSLLGGLGIALWQARIARAEAARADAERTHAERQLARTERVKDFMLTLFREQDPISRAKAQARSAPELIRDGIAQTDASFAEEPELKAELLRDLGEIQVGLDDDRKRGETTLQRAMELQTQLSGADSGASAETLAAYADAVYAGGDVTKAGTMMRDAVSRLRATRGAQDPKTAKAESSLAVVELIQGHYEEAERLSRHAIAVYRTTYGNDGAEVAPLLAVLGNIQQETGHLPESLASYEEALAIITRAQGAEHVRTVTLRSKMGDVLRVQRRFDEAREAYLTALRIERAQLPPGHTATGGTLLRLGDLQRRMRRFDEAEHTLGEAIAILGKTPSGQYAQALQFHGNLAQAQGKFDLAADRYRTALAAFRAATGESIYSRLTALKVAEALIQAGRLDEAEAIAADAVAAIAQSKEDNSYDAAYTADVMASLRHAQGREAEAEPLRRKTLELLVKIYGEDHAEVAQARIALAGSLIALRAAEGRTEAATLLDVAKTALERDVDDETEGMLGGLYLERCVLRLDSGDTAGARADIGEAIRRLQAPVHVSSLRRARAIGQKLDVRA